MANDINKSILETIKMVIENTKFKYDKTFKSRICEVNTNGTYKIVYMNHITI